MPNIGIAPLEAETPIGQLRLLLGDVTFKALKPIVAGKGDYEYFADSELQAFLTAGKLSVTRALGFGYMAYSRNATAVSVSLSQDDMSINVTRRPADWLALAEVQFRLAEKEEAAAGPTDFFFGVFEPGRKAC